jgi:hypothetical protein
MDKISQTVYSFSMETLRRLPDELLLKTTKELAHREREVTLSVLHHLQEVERRRLYARIGFPSLYEYAATELGYSQGAAYRRISSMRVLKSVPDIESKIEDGSLPISTLSQAQVFFRREEIVEPEKKIEILNALEGKSTRQVEEFLVQKSSAPEKLIPEKIRPLSKDLHHLSLSVNEKLLKKIEELKALVSHKVPSQSLHDLLELMVDESLSRHRVKESKNIPKLLNASPAPGKISGVAKSTRYISSETRKRIWMRDKGCCSYKDSKTGRICAARHFLEIDHIQPFVLGGPNTEENLRLLCRTHNQLRAEQSFKKRFAGETV